MIKPMMRPTEQSSGVRSPKGNYLRPDEKRPWLSFTLLIVIIAGCLFCELIIPYDPAYMELDSISCPPGRGHLFGTDPLGRDLFSVIWYGGRFSILIGLMATMISTGIAVVYGTLAGLVPPWADDGMMRFAEILMSVPQILFVMLLQAILGDATVLSISAVIGVSGWMAVAKMVRSEVRQLKNTGFVLAASAMGRGIRQDHGSGFRTRGLLFFYILGKHLAPNFLSAILFMVVTNIGSAIGMEATLSFMGLGLPTEVISWGSLMSLSQSAMLTGAWWMLLIPGTFLITTLICITELGEYLRHRNAGDRLV